MRGILSSAPAPSAIRLLVGSQVLLLIQAVLVLRSLPNLASMFGILLLLLAIVGIAALISAVIGEARAPMPDTRRRAPHDR